MPKQKKECELALQKPRELKLNAEKLPKGFTDGGVLYLEPKLDGLRGIAIVDHGECMLLTAGAVKVVNGPRIKAALEFAATQDKTLDNRVYDGEFFTKNWNLTNSLVKTQTKHPKRKKLSFRVFDTVPLDQWIDGKSTEKLSIRKLFIGSAIMAVASSALQVLPFKALSVKGHKDQLIIKLLKQFFEKCVKEGHEGAVAKNASAPYAFKKNNTWLKLKPFYSADLKVVGVEEGKPGVTGVMVGKLGAVYVEGKIDGKKVKTKCGGGFKMHEREKFWKLHKKGKLIGRIFEIKHEGLTVNNAVRFPRFSRDRWDKSKPN